MKPQTWMDYIDQIDDQHDMNITGIIESTCDQIIDLEKNTEYEFHSLHPIGDSYEWLIMWHERL